MDFSQKKSDNTNTALFKIAKVKILKLVLYDITKSVIKKLQLRIQMPMIECLSFTLIIYINIAVVLKQGVLKVLRKTADRYNYF